MNYRGRVFLIRHGDVEDNGALLFEGHTDVPLDEDGQYQAMNSGLELAGYQPNTDRIYSSDLLRASKAAEIIGNSLSVTNNGRNIEIVLKKEFRELNMGTWDGKLVDDIKRLYPKEFEKFNADPLNFKPSKDAENYYELQNRAIAAFYNILEEEHKVSLKLRRNPENLENGMFVGDEDRDVVLVTHSGVIRMLLKDFLGYSMDQALSLDIPKGSITLLEITT
ncbi:MAG: histidine phosphatase family protein [Clostridia bacterium]|nr:histidine phosphatase family protein [Clostridia bacterium]